MLKLHAKSNMAFKLTNLYLLVVVYVKAGDKINVKYILPDASMTHIAFPITLNGTLFYNFYVIF